MVSFDLAYLCLLSCKWSGLGDSSWDSGHSWTGMQKIGFKLPVDRVGYVRFRSMTVSLHHDNYITWVCSHKSSMLLVMSTCWFLLCVRHTNLTTASVCTVAVQSHGMKKVESRKERNKHLQVCKRFVTVEPFVMFVSVKTDRRSAIRGPRIQRNDATFYWDIVFKIALIEMLSSN